MQVSEAKSKTHVPSLLINFMIIIVFLCIIYLYTALVLVPKSTKHLYSSTELQKASSSSDTSLEHIVFGIASTKNSWLYRKEYVRVWWRPQLMRGCVFLEAMPPNTTAYLNDTNSLPPICISSETSRFRYTWRGGLPSAIRVARVVSETVALNHSNVRWYVFGDDDTIFFPENLMKTLSKYDHGLWYYIGTNSEMFQQNKVFGFDMAFGGAGFAVSYPLAKVLAKVFDSCLERYPHLYGSDSRVHACISELGVTLTHEPGFHQVDIRGNMFGLLAAHPVTPLVSLHHMDATDPIFPNMNRFESLQRLYESSRIDSQRILQQTVCYDRWYSWTISISWGYAVQVFRKHVFLPDALRIQETFNLWKMDSIDTIYNTIEYHPDPCQRPVVFFLNNANSSKDGITSVYKIKTAENCTFDMASPRKLQEIRVLSQKLNQSTKQLLAPRRQCCDLLDSTAAGVMNLAIRECGEDELIYMHP